MTVNFQLGWNGWVPLKTQTIKSYWKERGTLHRLISTKEIEISIKILSTKQNKTLGPHAITGEFYQILRKEISIQHKLF